MEHWIQLPRQLVESPSLEIFKSHLDVIMGKLLWVAWIEYELDWMDLEVPSSLSHDVTLW